MNKNLGFEKTEHLIFCPLCKQLVLAVRVAGMCGSYKRCSNCLIGFETGAWIYTYKMILKSPNYKFVFDANESLISLKMKLSIMNGPFEAEKQEE